MERQSEPDELTSRLADRLGALRRDHGWSLDELAIKSGISRATLSRLENASVSPTTSTLARLCPVYGLTLTHLLSSVETHFPGRVRADQQDVWHDAGLGFTRRSVSPPSRTLAGEVIECTIAPKQCIRYTAPPRPGLEHHLVLLDGTLEVTVDEVVHSLNSRDCLRYQLRGASFFQTGPAAARYLLFLV